MTTTMDPPITVPERTCKFGCGFETLASRPNSVLVTHYRSCARNPERERTTEEKMPQWQARAARGECVPLEELAGDKNRLQKLLAMVGALAKLGGVVEHPSGLATGILANALPFTVSNGALNQLMERLEDGGWLTRRKNGKRTYEIRLIAGDVPTAAFAAAGGTVARSAWGTANGAGSAPAGASAPPLQPIREPIEPEARTEPPAASPAPSEQPSPAQVVAEGEELKAVIDSRIEAMLGREETAALGGRPGRLAARIEDSIPELVTAAVNTTIENWMTTLLGTMGFHRGGMPQGEIAQLVEDNDRLEAERSRMVGTIERQTEQITRLTAMVDYLTDEAESRLLGSNDGQIASKEGLTPRQVPDVFRRTAEYLTEYGWSIRKCRGSQHLAWKAPPPLNRVVYSASTPSDPTVNSILWRKLHRLGVPSIPHGWSPGDPVPPMNANNAGAQVYGAQAQRS